MVVEQHSLFELPGPGEYLIPEGAEPTQCNSCQAPIVWGKTHSDTAVPLDLGSVRLINGQRYARTHFATCPQAREWRRR